MQYAGPHHDKGSLWRQSSAGSVVRQWVDRRRGMLLRLFAVRPKLRTGLEVRPSFSLSLNEKDLELLRNLQAFFGCGWIRESKTDRTFKYEARAVADLLDPIIPHFGRHPLRGSKAKSFAAFRDVCLMIEQGDHLRRDGLRSIIGIAYEMNLGKRRLARDDLLRALMR